MSIAVYYFSGAGHSLAAARYIAGETGAQLCKIKKDPPVKADTVVVVFPVYCQNIPEPVRQFLRVLTAGRIAAAATYGRISHGSVLCDVERSTGKRLTAGAYIPTGHTYLHEPALFDRDALSPFIEKLKDEEDFSAAVVPRGGKDPLAYIFPALRSRIGVRLTRSSGSLCIGCGACTESCPVGAMRGGHPGARCIRCLRCVSVCPQHALDFTCRPVLKKYLDGRRREMPAEVYV